MSFINKNVNIFLFLLVILTITVMVAGTVFYGGRFTNVTADYNIMVKQVEQLNQELIKFRAQYNYSQAILDKTKTEKENLKKVYTTQTGKLESDIDTLNSTLSTVQLELNKVKLELSSTKEQLEDTKDKLESAESKLDLRTKESLCYKKLLTQSNIDYSSCD